MPPTRAARSAEQQIFSAEKIGDTGKEKQKMKNENSKTYQNFATAEAIELIKNIDKIHTTEMGRGRISRNLFLGECDAVLWCKEKILDSKEIFRKGKNWYITTGEAIITVNAASYTIITAHKMKAKK